MTNSTSLPSTLTARVYPSQPTADFPELDHPRYRPSSHPFGVCFSGGGTRSFSASLGQMRGLEALGLLDSVGAISCVSGGSWFSTLFSYAPTEIDDATLLGPILAPGEITRENLAQLDPQCLASPIPDINDVRIGEITVELVAQAALSGPLELNRVYSRLINEILVKPFKLDSTETFFTLDAETIKQITKLNPDLTASHFYTMRPNRPYLIACATQIYPIGEDQKMRHFEYTPLYVGTPELFKGAGADGLDIGGGYVQSFAFGSQPLGNRLGCLKTFVPDFVLQMLGRNNQLLFEQGYVTVPTPNPQFLLSDVMGSSGAAPGIVLDHLGEPDWLPEFNYWPVVNDGHQKSTSYSFVDGGSLENTGIVSLLRRQYPVILAFVNSSLPLDSDSKSEFKGIDVQISRLFGFNPKKSLNEQDTQIFASEKFDALANGLKSAKAKGKATYFVDSYQIQQPNRFDIPSYPDNGEVTVVWFYNDVNQEWKNQLTPSVLELLNSGDSDPTNNMKNFPNYDTISQNKGPHGVPQLLQLTAEQINLLAHMSCYTVTNNAGETIQSLKRQFKSA